jgi:hypothetical protein
VGTLDTGSTGPSSASLNVQPRSRAVDWNDSDMSEARTVLQESARNGQWSFFKHPASCIVPDAHHVILLMGYSDFEPSLLQSAVDGETPRSWRIESTVKRRND